MTFNNLFDFYKNEETQLWNCRAVNQASRLLLTARSNFPFPSLLSSQWVSLGSHRNWNEAGIVSSLSQPGSSLDSHRGSRSTREICFDLSEVRCCCPCYGYTIEIREFPVQLNWHRERQAPKTSFFTFVLTALLNDNGMDRATLPQSTP